MSSHKKKCGRIPERWLYCPPNGNHLVVAKFMPFKTPLDKSYHMSSAVKFPPQELFRRAKQNCVKIGLWIDLTNTYRYYNKNAVRQEGCQYVKLKCKGHGQAPPIGTTKLFISLVHDYIVKHPFEVIAVHCTHGFNRTGFLIISFVIEKLGFEITQALDVFAQSRPPGIYKEDYIRELFRRYGNIDNAPPAPAMPEWCKVTVENKRKRQKRKQIDNTTECINP